MKALSIAIGLWAAVALSLGSNAGLPVWGLIVIVYGGLLVLIVSAIAMIVRRRFAPLPPAIVLIVWALIASGAAFRVRFIASLPWLTPYVSETRASTLQPRIVGLFHVTETEVVEGGAIRLITTDCMFDDCGLAFRQQGSPPGIEEDTYAHLMGGWWQWERSW